MSSNMYSLIIILVIAILTFFARFFPFLLFSRGGQKPPEMVTYLGNVLPPAVMILLIVYCLKDIDVGVYPHGIPEAAAILVTVVLYKITKNNLIAMVCGTICYMFLIQLVFN